VEAIRLHDKEHKTMTDRETLAGLDDIAEDSGTLGLNLYAYFDGGMQTLFNSANLGQGPGAVAWLTGDFFGVGESGIAQLWDNNGKLGLNIYEAFGTVGTLFSSADLGQGSGALAWLTGDFSGSGRTEIAQLWDNDGRLGLNVFGGDAHGSTMQTVAGSADLGQGTGAVAWLTGDFLGVGQSGIAQLWDNNGKLGLNVYLMGPFGPGTAFSSTDLLDQGPGALAWLTGDFTGSGHTEIAQPWDDGGVLGLVVYRVQADGSVHAVTSSDLGQGPGALAWLAGDFTGSGHTEIAQLWDNDGTLAVTFYSVSGDRVTEVTYTSLGQGPGALAWLPGDFTGSGHTEIAQLWDNNGNLGLNVFGISGNTETAVFHSVNMGQGSGALAWLADNFTAGLTVIAQPWAS
jgi:hypothetical protein